MGQPYLEYPVEDAEGKESNEAGQVYYHHIRQAAGKKRMKPDTNLDLDLTKHHHR